MTYIKNPFFYESGKIPFLLYYVERAYANLTSSGKEASYGHFSAFHIARDDDLSF